MKDITRNMEARKNVLDNFTFLIACHVAFNNKTFHCLPVSFVAQKIH